MKKEKKLSLLRQQVNYWHSMTDNNEHVEVRLVITSFLIHGLEECFYLEYNNLKYLYEKYIKSQTYEEGCENRNIFFDYFEKNIENNLCEEALLIVQKGLR